MQCYSTSGMVLSDNSSCVYQTLLYIDRRSLWSLSFADDINLMSDNNSDPHDLSRRDSSRSFCEVLRGKKSSGAGREVPTAHMHGIKATA